ncbi:MAG: hypothetical protein V9F46_05975 [Chitinophagaceae bacterium]
MLKAVLNINFGKQLRLKRNKKEILLDKIINRLSSKIIVPSGDVWVR